MRGTLRAIRYARSWKTGADIVSSPTEIDRGGQTIPATLVLPSRGRGPLPAWVCMGGVTRMGRFHPQLVRFSEALASSGAAVLVPEIPEWQNLRVTPDVAGPTIRGCIDRLAREPRARPGKVGLVGFSFGAPQVALAATREDLADQVAGIVLFGGYCCLERTLVCQFTGDHEWEGVDYALSPDPYGRWVVASNHLTDVPGLEDAHDVAAALHRLAIEASATRIRGWEPHHDEMIRDLRQSLPGRRQELFDLFATPSTGRPPPREETHAMALQLAAACRRVSPLLEPGPRLSGVRLPTRLVHGRGDRLIPFTEGMRLSNELPDEARRGITVTGLFHHTADRDEGSLLARARDSAVFFDTLRNVLTTV